MTEFTMTKFNYFRLLLLVILLILITLGSYWLRYQSDWRTKQASPSPRPDFSLPDLQGKMHSISQWNGKVIVVNFWATWCPPCIREIPHFVQMQQRYAEKGLQIIGIAIDNPVAVKRFVNQTHINYPILVDQENQAQAIAIAQEFGNQYGTLPFTVIIDQQGMIVIRYPGELDPQTLEEMILSLF